MKVLLETKAHGFIDKVEPSLTKLSESGMWVSAEVKPEYDLKSLRVRKVGPNRAGFGGHFVQLTPDVAEVFPDADAVNEALRFLIRITRENQVVSSVANKGT